MARSMYHISRAANEALLLEKKRKDHGRVIPVTRPSLPDLDKYLDYLKKLWVTKWITNNGEFALLLEKKLKEYLKVDELVLVSNGTLALQLALRSCISRGEVITTPFTFVATTNAILWEGFKPVFADIDPDTFNIDPDDIERKLTKKTRAVLAVHVYGNPCSVDEIKAIADEHDVKVIYDGAHSFGVEYDKKSVFDYGDVSTLSFHATKCFHTIEGGALVTKNKELGKRLRLLRDHGIRSEESMVGFGTNAKMNEFQAAMGLCNIEDFDRNEKLRETLYSRYVEKLRRHKKLKFQRLNASKYNYAYMPVCFEDQEERDKVHGTLLRRGIHSRKYFYPLTVDTDYFREQGTDLVTKFRLKTASEIAGRVLCLPLYPELPLDVVDEIAKIVSRII